jgi:hypothetical protein
MSAVDISPEPGQIQVVPKRTLGQKLVEIALSIDRIEKDKTFPGQGNWKYASAENMLATVRGEFLSRGVLVLASERETTDRPRTTRQGDETAVTTVHLTFTLMDTESPDEIELDWVGRGEDPADRGIGKALTNAIKTFMRQQLMLPWGDDPEASDSDGPSGYGGSQGGTINLLSEARGLSDDVLSQILSSNGVAVTGSPLTTFTRIPGASVPGVRAALQAARS